jgi:hypothetical protein
VDEPPPLLLLDEVPVPEAKAALDIARTAAAIRSFFMVNSKMTCKDLCE